MSSAAVASDSALSILGSSTPRLYTPPLRELTPETSYGFDVIDFARDVLNRPPDPWQEFALIHGCELLPDGRPRFRLVLVLAARQNGKTEIPVVLSAYWQFVDRVPIILGTSTKIDYAVETWKKTTTLVERSRLLDDQRPERWKRETNGENQSWSYPDPETGAASRYKIAASNAEGGRSLSIDRLVMDELRQHHDYSAHDAMVPAGNAVHDFQAWCMTNAGDDRSVVLNDLREQALEEIEQGITTSRLGLLEWSAPLEADPEDPYALAQANPNVGRRLDMGVLLDAARAAKAKGGAKLTGFKTEVMCIRVPHLSPAIDPVAWQQGYVPGDLERVRSRVALCLDVAPDLQHATVVAAALLTDGRVRIETVKAWDGPRATAELRRALPALVAKVKPRAFGWLPGGPAAAMSLDMAKRKGWPPAGVVVAELRTEVAAVCMGFAEQVASGSVVHNDDALLNAHVGGAEPLKRGDGWVFSRRGEGHVDAAYAAAGAVHLARALPPPMGKPRLVVVKDPP
jgi:hypothetical protein